ncbi:hypothetical protein GDO81_006087 [Engystomops pustulosus]|uniref:Uncharacterized protein n=1 Tax=Engystomops pustulosus TaxID=76066 RepID=A0AAV7CXM6_ENGPU|nr:hypothetical protein GDO81_006087 [Engystomops pustulosus]
MPFISSRVTILTYCSPPSGPRISTFNYVFLLLFVTFTISCSLSGPLICTCVFLLVLFWFLVPLLVCSGQKYDHLALWQRWPDMHY